MKLMPDVPTPAIIQAMVDGGISRVAAIYHYEQIMKAGNSAVPEQPLPEKIFVHIPVVTFDRIGEVITDASYGHLIRWFDGFNPGVGTQLYVRADMANKEST